MKKMILLVCTCLIGISILAQSNRSLDSSKMKNEFKFAKLRWLTLYALFGIDANSIGGDDDSYDQMLIGGEAGVGFPLISFNQHTGIGGELLYAMRGSKYNDEYVKGKVVLSYIMLPLFARHDFGQGFFAEAGLQPALLVSAKDKYDGGSDNFKKYINSFDLGALGGLGYNFKRKAGLGLRYSRGITNLNKGDDAKDHNSSFSLRLMWFFGS